jgi:PAS domain S-box-containing protein
MKDERKTKRQLIEELQEIRERLAGLVASWEKGATGREQFSVFMKHLPAGVFVKATSGRFLYVNHYLRERFDAERWLGRSVTEVMPGAMSESMLADDRAAMESGHLVRVNIVQDRDGRDRIYETHKFPIKREGKPDLLGGIAIEITERRRIEEDRERLAKAVEQTGESIIITDALGVIQYVNPAFEAVTGYSRREVIGTNPRILKSGQHSPEFYGEMWRVISGGSIWMGRLINRKKDGTIYEEEATISPIRDASGTIVNYLAVKRDVSQEVRLQEQLLQAMKMEAVGRLAGGVAHDFKNLLMVILNRAEFAKDKIGESSPAYNDLVEILQATDRAAELARQLLTLSRRQPLTLQRVDVNIIAGEFRQMLQPLVGEGITISFKPGEGLHGIEADPAQIEQIMMNLAVNARDAMPEGGTITIETANVRLEEDDRLRFIDIRDFRPGEFVMIAVSDDGLGMTDGVRSRIFEPFFTTKSRKEGTGLGLSTVYGIVKQHGGYIDVESQPEVGTTFRTYFPVLEPLSSR